MYEKLSHIQREIFNFNDGAIVVKACPGSGKTYSVAARISRLIREKDMRKKGLAVISFTNIASQEIEEKLSNDFNTPTPLKQPHFLGTIDSFINNFIFLPFGHLLMKCTDRPELVGEPHGPWTVNKHEFDFDQYFDKTTFDIDNKLIPIAPYQAFHFRWLYYNQNGEVNGNIKNIIASKKNLFRQGYANQSDANFIAWKILEKYPLIAKNLANKFQYILIDECQDTSEIQMKILDILNSKGASNIMLVGDRDQSIFEWNDAKPELFDNKYNTWGNITLNENRRSSERICNFIKNLSSFSLIQSVNEEVKNFNFDPKIVGYIEKKEVTKKNPIAVSFEESKASFTQILNDFLTSCENNNISIDKNSVAVLYRGKAISSYLGLSHDIHDFQTIPWVKNHYHVKAIIKGKHLYDVGELNKGYKLLEKGYFEGLNKPGNQNFYCTNNFILENIQKIGLKAHRKAVFNFINCLPSTRDKTIIQWVSETNLKLNDTGINFSLSVNPQNSNILIDNYFGDDLNSEGLYPFYFGTIHSVKGRTFEAVLILLSKKSGSKNYENIINEKPELLDSKYLEEMRIIYVGISRPRKILYMAVPISDENLWKIKMQPIIDENLLT